MAQVEGISSVQDLPLDLLASVLQHVQQPNRLRCCALVSRNWRQAANMTTSTVDLTADSEQKLDSLSTWLDSSSYASRIQSIQVAYKIAAAHAGESTRPVLRIPFAVLKQLKSLQLQQCQVQIVSPAADAIDSPAATAATMAAVLNASTSPAELTALSSLELVNTSVDLYELSICTGLQHLQLCGVDHIAAEAAVRDKCKQGGSPQAGANILSQLALALPQLTQLTHLHIWHDASKQDSKQKQLTSAFFASLNKMQQLKELQLSITPFQSTALAHIPTSLSALHLHDSPAWGSSMLPQLQQMTQLQYLRLERPKQVDPAVLFTLNQLTWLSITECPHDKPGAVTGLLKAVQQLQQLRHLDLACCLAAEPYDDELYAALTASSHLTSLNITTSDCNTSDIIRCACADIFPESFTSTTLVSIAIHPDLLNSYPAFQRITTCCPALEHLAIIDYDDRVAITQLGFHKLQGLSALTTLILDCPVKDYSLKAIAACSQLKQLTLHTPLHANERVTPAGLMQITQLTGLTRLSVFVRMGEELLFEQNLVAANGVPVVYLQLQQALAKYK